MEPYLMSWSSCRNRNTPHDTILNVVQLRKAELHANTNSWKAPPYYQPSRFQQLMVNWSITWNYSLGHF